MSGGPANLRDIFRAHVLDLLQAVAEQDDLISTIASDVDCPERLSIWGC